MLRWVTVCGITRPPYIWGGLISISTSWVGVKLLWLYYLLQTSTLPLPFIFVSVLKEDEDKSSTFGPSPLLYRYVVQETPKTNSFTAEAKNIRYIVTFLNFL